MSSSSSSENLVSVLPSRGGSTATTTIPSTESIVSLLASRYRQDEAYTNLAASALVAVNPLDTLPDVSDASARDYAAQQDDPQSTLPPHPFQLASRVWLSLNAERKHQTIVYSGISGSGKTFTSSLVTSQLVRLSPGSSKRAARLPDQLKALDAIFNSFATAKTEYNSSASRVSRLLELHYQPQSTSSSSSASPTPPQEPQLIGAQVYTFGLDKERITHVGREQRSFNIFYQLLAGSTPLERQDYFLLNDATDYRYLRTGASSLPNAPSSNDAIAFDDLRASLQLLGIKPKYIPSILSILSAVLLLGNIDFFNHEPHNDSDLRQPTNDPAWIDSETKIHVQNVANLLKIDPETLETRLLNRTRYVKKEVCTILLDSHGAAQQRDSLAQSLYTILFAFFIESSNARLSTINTAAPSSSSSNTSTGTDQNLIVSQLDLPGFQSNAAPTFRRQSTLLDSAVDQRFGDFCYNFQAELLQHWLHRCTFDESLGVNSQLVNDSIALANVDAVDPSVSRIELLRGDLLLSSKCDRKPGGILGQIGKAAGAVKKGKNEDPTSWIMTVRERFRTSTALGKQETEADRKKSSLKIQHFVNPVVYDASNFVQNDSDLVDADFISILRSSQDPFISRLFSGPSLAAEVHPKDPNVIVTAQISNLPFRRPACLNHAAQASPDKPMEPLLESSDIHPVTIQVNATLSSLLVAFENSNAHLWNVFCLRPNDGLSSSSRWNNEVIKAQIAALNLGEYIARKRIEYTSSFDFDTFQSRYLSSASMSKDQISERLNSIAFEQNWSADLDYSIGDNRVWLAPTAFKYFDGKHRAHLAEIRRQKQEQDRLKQEQEEKDRQGSDSDRAMAAASLEGRRMSAQSSSTRGPFADPPAGTIAAIAGSEWTHGSGEYSVPQSPVANNDNNHGNENSSHHNNNHGSRESNDLLDQHSPNARLMSDEDHQDQQQSRQPPPPQIFAGNNPIVDSPAGSDHNATTTPNNEYFHQGYHPRAQTWDDTPYDSKSAANMTIGQSKEKILESSDPNRDDKDDDIEEHNVTVSRRLWLIITWFFTWWIPSFVLKYCGRMKRPDVRMAWREKVAIFMLILLFCGLVIFIIIGLQWVVCPKFNYAWNEKELGYHQGESDYWVAVRGEVYDLTKFWRGDHSDITGQDSSNDLMMQLAGQDLTNYFPIPLTIGCQGLVTSDTISMMHANFTAEVPTAVHTSGNAQGDKSSALADENWYPDRFLPKMRDYHKGPYVMNGNALKKGLDLETPKKWAVYNGGVYDLTDYFYTLDYQVNNADYEFLPSEITDLFQEQPGQDVTSAVNNLNIDESTRSAAMACMKNVFFVAHTDFRETARCQFPGYLLIAFTAILVATMLSKFLAALQLSSKKIPEPRDKFVVMQVPCYTEGESSLKKTIDSLANLKYDDKRKLLFVICDGMIVGSGNDRPTPRIVLDLLGVDPKHDPDPLLMRSVGEGSRQLNYGKVYSGLYEYEGHILPYVVVVKVGKPSERSRPGNRGKRDSQVLLLRFLNRVHFDSEMTPLELEVYHQIKNVIGVDPQLYEYLLCVDADTEVRNDSLTRLISVAADDSKIVGLCGETKLSNEQRSWWTMIQVYEYFISHHLVKAFESLFGTVTCLPGCFSLYRLRTNDKGRPLVTSNLVIDDYAVGEVDTLHKKNLLHLGEDRYFTTLILKHFPRFKTKFTPDAIAVTVAPDRWSILLSQRRRWINSTVHNLVELLNLKDMCGFCCFSMRFIVMIDLVGTIMLPATTCYLVYIIVMAATGTGSIPMITIIMLCATYGLQVIIFLLKRQWQFIGWLVIYLLAYPVYSFLLPLYSFWHMDDFSWGNTRVVVGEGKKKKILTNGDDDHFDESMIPMRKFSEYQSMAWEMGSEYSRDSRLTGSILEQSAMGGPGGMMAGRPASFKAGSVSGDYYRDGPKSKLGHSYQNSGGLMPRSPSFVPPNQPWTRSPAGSVSGSDYGGGNHSRRQTMASMGNNNGWGGSQYGGAYDMFGGGGGSPGFMAPPQNRQSTFSAFTNFQAGAGGAGGAPSMMGGHMGRSQSGVFSMMGGSQGGMPGVSLSTDPSPQELRAAVRAYLGTQDLMTVTKRTARAGVANMFPNASLEGRESECNQYIDEFCQGQ